MAQKKLKQGAYTGGEKTAYRAKRATASKQGKSVGQAATRARNAIRGAATHEYVKRKTGKATYGARMGGAMLNAKADWNAADRKGAARKAATARRKSNAK